MRNDTGDYRGGEQRLGVFMVGGLSEEWEEGLIWVGVLNKCCSESWNIWR